MPTTTTVITGAGQTGLAISRCLRPGMHVEGLPFLRTRRSGLIDGVGQHAEVLSDHLLSHLATTAGRSR